MSFAMTPGMRYRMPVLFGPTPGPRQGPDGKPFDCSAARRTVTSLSFRTEAAAIEALLPEGFALWGAPMVTLEHTVLENLSWLAGRGYTMLGVKVPVRFSGAQETVQGPLLTVLWENLGDPIISGREELGYNKLYAELPPPENGQGSRTCRALWGGFEFLRLEVEGLAPATPPASPADPAARADGVLHYAYRPPLNNAPADQAQTAVMLGPAPASAPPPDSYLRGQGRLSITPGRWQDLPTLHHIVTVLAALPQIETGPATVLAATGGADLRDQRPVL